MFTHYLKIAARGMRRFKLQTIVCLTGLAVGMTCFALGTLWLRYIESFEDFVPDKEHIYYVTGGDRQDGHGYNYYTRHNAGKVLMDSVPAVTDYCTIIPYPSQKTGAPNNSVTVSVNLVDSAFFRFFGVTPLRGSVMKTDGCIVLTESAAKRLFNDEDPLGKEVSINNEIVKSCDTPDSGEVAVGDRMMVSAIIPDCPQNTQFWYEALLPTLSTEKLVDEHYSSCYTFLKLNPNAKLDSIVGVPMRIEYKSYPFKQYPELIFLDTYDFLIVPLQDLRSLFPSDNVMIRTEFVQWFMLLGALVILCSVINYLITMVSHLRRRSWEFSLRRVLGSRCRDIVAMVCIETMIVFILAALMSGVLNLFVLPVFREYSGISLPVYELEKQLVKYLCLVIVCGLLASALTARIVMWRTQRNILSSRQLSHSSHTLDRFGIVLQMALSMGIVFSLVVMLRQVNHLMYSPEIGFTHKDLGVVSPCSEEMRAKIHHSALADTILDNYWPVFPHELGVGYDVYDERKGSDGRKEIDADMIYIDKVFADFFGLQLVCGDWPQAGKYKHDTRTQQEIDFVSFDKNNGNLTYHYHDVTRHPYEVCVSEEMCRVLQVAPENAIGLSLFDSDEYRIGGVVKDTYVMGPLIHPRPVVYRHTEGYKYGPTLLFHAKPGRAQELCDSIEQWNQGCQDQSKAYNLETEYEKYVASEMMLIKILMAVGGASLFVCVIGTFSLVSLSLQQRRKEIAIRKVHGAKMRDILRLFLRGQVASLIIAALAAYPVAYILMRHWLEGYQKQVAISWWLMPATLAAIAAVVLGTITLKIWRAARESTVEALNS